MISCGVFVRLRTIYCFCIFSYEVCVGTLPYGSVCTVFLPKFTYGRQRLLRLDNIIPDDTRVVLYVCT